MTAAPDDIEIYIHGVSADQVIAWLIERFGTLPSTPTRRNRSTRLSVAWGERSLPVLIVEDACDGFTSVCFDSPQTPWADDLACAREARTHFGVELRCSRGSWRPDAAGEAGWWQLLDGDPVPLAWE